MIAVILAAGKGKRISTLCKESSKCLLRLGNQSLLQRKIIALAKCKKISKIIIVIREGDSKIPNEIGRNFGNITISYCEQDSLTEGIVSAAYSPKELKMVSDNENVKFCLGDEYYQNFDFDSMLCFHQNNESDFTTCIVPTRFEEKIKRNYTIEIDENMRILNAIEKPTNVLSKYIGCGNFIIRGQLLKEFSQIRKYEFADSQLVDWIKFIIARHGICLGYVFDRLYSNVNFACDYIYLNALYKNEDINEFQLMYILNIVVKKGANCTISDIQVMLLEKMPEYELPKIEMLTENKESNIFPTKVQEISNTEGAIIKIWCSLLKEKHVDVNQNFFRSFSSKAMSVK